MLDEEQHAALVLDSGPQYFLGNVGGDWFIDTQLSAHVPGGISSIAFEHGVLAVGVPNDSTAGLFAGSVITYARNKGWKKVGVATAADAESADAFGEAVDLEGARLLVGAPFDDTFGLNAGALYEYRVDHGAARVHCIPKPSSVGCVAHIGFSGSPSLSSGQVFDVSAFRAQRDVPGYLLYGTAGPQFQPFAGGVRCVNGPTRVIGLQQSGAGPPGDACSGAFSFDFNAFAASGADSALVVGAVVNAQWIYRDASAFGGNAASDAIEFELLP